jgi:type II secretory pathway pseudopilin PulG
MVAILLILFIILLFPALPTWPYSGSGRVRYHVVSLRERTVRAAAELTQLSGGDAVHTTAEDYAVHFRELQNELQKAVDKAAKRKVDRSKNNRERQAA